MDTISNLDDAEQFGPLDRLLRDAAAVPDQSGWAAARARFVAGAAHDGLIDVAFEDHDTPLGRVRLSATPAGVVRLILPAEDQDAVLERLAGRLSPRIVRSAMPVLTQARHQLDEYFDGRRHQFELPLDWTLTTAFRREVLRATVAIPYGQTASYREVATVAGRPKAVRAAGSALATNPLPIIVPCHRVLRTDGGIGQYLGGAAAKRRLLTLEHAI